MILSIMSGLLLSLSFGSILHAAFQLLDFGESFRRMSERPFLTALAAQEDRLIMDHHLERLAHRTQAILFQDGTKLLSFDEPLIFWFQLCPSGLDFLILLASRCWGGTL